MFGPCRKGWNDEIIQQWNLSGVFTVFLFRIKRLEGGSSLCAEWHLLTSEGHLLCTHAHTLLAPWLCPCNSYVPNVCIYFQSFQFGENVHCVHVRRKLSWSNARKIAIWMCWWWLIIGRWHQVRGRQTVASDSWGPSTHCDCFDNFLSYLRSDVFHCSAE